MASASELREKARAFLALIDDRTDPSTAKVYRALADSYALMADQLDAEQAPIDAAHRHAAGGRTR